VRSKSEQQWPSNSAKLQPGFNETLLAQMHASVILHGNNRFIGLSMSVHLRSDNHLQPGYDTNNDINNMPTLDHSYTLRYDIGWRKSGFLHLSLAGIEA